MSCKNCARLERYSVELRFHVEHLNREFDQYMRFLAESIGCDMVEFNLPSAHGNDRLRWAVLIAVQLQKKGAISL